MSDKVGRLLRRHGALATRRAILSGALSPALQEKIRRQTDEEEAAMAFAAVVGPRAVGDLFDEVDRRAAMYEERWRTGPFAPAVTPRCAAFRSVTHDVSCGWL